MKTDFPISKWHRLARITALSAVFVTVSTEQAFAQAAFIRYQVAFNGGFFGPPTIVSDNQPGDVNPAPSFLTVPVTTNDGVITFSATIIGQGFTVPGTPLAGRRLLVTAATASVPVGYFTPLNMPFPTIEL